MNEMDKKIDVMLEKISREKASIAKAEKFSCNTTMSFSYTEKPGDAINLRVERDLGNFARIVGFLLYRERAYAEGVKELGIDKAPPFKWQGYTPSEWIEDIKVCIDKIQIATKRKNLEQLEARLDKIISPEKRRELELAAIEKELS